VLEDVALLVGLAALHEAEAAEDVADRLAQRLRAVDHEKQGPVRGQAPLDQVAQQRLGHGAALRRALPEPEPVLRAVGGHAQSQQHAVLAEGDPVDQDDPQVELTERLRR
jgi:hypothetical protein